MAVDLYGCCGYLLGLPEFVEGQRQDQLPLIPWSHLPVLGIDLYGAFLVVQIHGGL